MSEWEACNTCIKSTQSATLFSSSSSMDHDRSMLYHRVSRIRAALSQAAKTTVELKYRETYVEFFCLEVVRRMNLSNVSVLMEVQENAVQYLGQLCAKGVAVRVPIILSMLAESPRPIITKLVHEAQSLSLLEIGLFDECEQDDPSRVYNDYDYGWWVHLGGYSTALLEKDILSSAQLHVKRVKILASSLSIY